MCEAQLLIFVVSAALTGGSPSDPESPLSPPALISSEAREFMVQTAKLGCDIAKQIMRTTEQYWKSWQKTQNKDRRSR
jgi:hypothetical protein